LRTIRIDEVKTKLFEKFGDNIVLLEYSQMNKISKFRCNKHDVEFYTRAGSLISRGIGCSFCANEGRHDKHAFSYEYVKNYINSTDCILISDNYEGVDDKLSIKFSCGHTSEISFYSFKKGSRCPECGKKLGGISKRLNIDDIKARVKEKNIEIIEFCEEYKGQSTLVKSKCRYGHIEEHSIASLLYTKGCRECANMLIGLSKSGEKSKYWKGGIYGISKFLKSQMKSWKKDSLNDCDYKCVICGNINKLDVHHLYSFSSIIKDIFSELDISLKQTVSEYSPQEIYLLINKSIEIHKNYPLGKALCREHHKLFHTIYGQENNTPEQFEEFYFALKNINKNNN
jgi:hypothetical protein